MLLISSEQDMLDFGAKMAIACPVPFVIFLYGNLGAGKTTLVRGFLRGLGYQGIVKSPTYTLVEPYQMNDFMVFHFDFYRLNDPHELDFIGIQDYVGPNAICLMEWPEKGEGFLPRPDLSCYIEFSEQGRKLKIMPHTEQGQNILKRLEDET